MIWLMLVSDSCIDHGAALANKFIDEALEFNPKLLILIVPRESER